MPGPELVGHAGLTSGRVGEIFSRGSAHGHYNWPACKSLTEVRGFLGTAGLVHMFIKDYAEIAEPLQ